MTRYRTLMVLPDTCFYQQISSNLLSLPPDQRLLRKNSTLQWRHNGRDSVSNHQPHDCLLNRLFRRRSKKTPKLRVTGLCMGNSPGTGEFPAQMASYAEKVSIWWRHHDMWFSAARRPATLYQSCHEGMGYYAKTYFNFGTRVVVLNGVCLFVPPDWRYCVLHAVKPASISLQ